MGIQMTDTVVCVNKSRQQRSVRGKGVNVHSLVSVDGYMMKVI